ncbi:MAG: GntR family transcriptional regulator [Anaerolineales bacterium]|nr:GntR family transcriptional regulator [Anaerolineales bacterium]
MNAEQLSPLVSGIRLDLRSGVPIYTQIMEQIKQLVSGGVLQTGDQLPTVRALAQELRVNFNTVARAYRLLDEAGIISTQQGRGTYISDFPLPEKTEELRKQALKKLAARYLQDGFRLGATSGEIEEVLGKLIADWRQSEQ